MALCTVSSTSTPHPQAGSLNEVNQKVCKIYIYIIINGHPQLTKVKVICVTVTTNVYVQARSKVQGPRTSDEILATNDRTIHEQQDEATHQQRMTAVS